MLSYCDVEIIEMPDEVVVIIDLPGHTDPKKLEVQLTPYNITFIDNTIPKNTDHRNVYLPSVVKPDTISSTISNGVVEVKIKKSQPDGRIGARRVDPREQELLDKLFQGTTETKKDDVMFQ